MLTDRPSALTAADIAELRPRRTPMIPLGEHVPDLAGDSVAIDYQAAWLQMTEHLRAIDRQIASIGIQRNLAVDAMPALPSSTRSSDRRRR